MTPNPPTLGPRRPRLLHLFLFHGIWLSAAVALILASREVILPFVLALVVAYVFTPVVARLERARIPRWAAILLTYGVALGSLYASIRVTAPTLTRETLRLRAEIPALAEWLRTDLIPQVEQRFRQIGVEIDLDKESSLSLEPPTASSPPRLSFLQRATLKALDYSKSHTVELLGVGRAVLAAISRGIFVFFLTLMLAAYLMLTRERIIGFFRNLFLPPYRAAFDRFLERADRGLSGVVRGQLLICLVNGILSGIGFWALGLKYWFLFSVIAGAMSIIPIFGAILSSIPAVAIALTQSLGLALGVLAWIVTIHQIEANFLNPKIIGDAAKIHPVLVVFSLVVGEHLFHLPGALLAVPCLSLAQSLFLHFRDVIYGSTQDEEPEPSSPSP
ncbi:MAG: AI-2E family transporter [Myxococcales bacterium]|nr:AI-2E family transporter [Polyangiaceae bacterium]MDW8250423.1 AI-2E family transporter [Myxococcales bacterium]